MVKGLAQGPNYGSLAVLDLEDTTICFVIQSLNQGATTTSTISLH